MAKLKVFNIDGKEKTSIELPSEVFGEAVNKALLYQAITMYRASLRQGTASTKERADVRGGGKKPYRQKGTGRARHGSSRSPIWQGGGVTFGPHPRKYSYTLPKKVRSAALRESLNAKYKAENIVCIDEIKGEYKKTKEFAKVLGNFKITGKILALLDGADSSVVLASRNIPRFNMKRSNDINAFDVLQNKNLLVTKEAFENLLKRVGK